jgi:putative addiction module component (TIGR02574 family)
MTLELITSEVLKLDRLSRIELIRRLAESIVREERAGSDAEDEPELTPEQAQEIDRRMKLFEAGKMTTIPGEQVTARLIEKYGLQR